MKRGSSVSTPWRKASHAAQDYSVEERNKLAVQLMQSSDVAIDDLYATAKPIMEKHGRPNDVHFAPEGYEVLATAVVASIESALAKR